MDPLLDSSLDHSVSFRPRLVAPLMILGTIALIEGLQRIFEVHVPSPSPIFLLMLACGVFISGLRSGMISALLVLGYLAFFFNGVDGPWLVKPTIITVGRMILVSVVAPSIVLIIGLLKRRLLTVERANAAIQRRETEELLRLATETAGIGIFSYDPAEGGKTTLSAQGRTNYGVARETVFDLPTLLDQLVIPEDRERVKQSLHAALDPADNGIYEIEYRIHRPSDGSERWLAVRGRALPAANGHRNIVGATIDITERKESERGLLLLKAAVESANDGVVITEAALELPGPRIEYANAAFSKMTGYSTEELLGKTPRILQGPRTDMGLLGRLRNALKSGDAFHAETVNYRKGGEPYYVEWRITAVRDPVGKVTQWVAVQRDVSARVEAEKERERILESERSTRLELERAGRIKDEFLATLSHELRTPLNAIVGWLHLFKTDPANPDMQQAAIEVIERNSRAQLQLIEDLLDVSRIVSGKMRLQVRSVVLADVIKAALEAARPGANAREIQLESQLDPTVSPVSGDPDRLQQVVWNLLSNAVKFTPKGGRVQVRLERTGSVVKIVVADNGLGIAPEFLPHLFERFRQADSSSTRSHSGLGIGLALVRHLVELHGGTVQAASEGAGQGATFTVTLPLAAIIRDSENGTAVTGELGLVGGDYPGQSAKSAGALGGVRILTVDDDPDTRELLTTILSAHGATVTAATNVPDGLAAFRKEPPELLLCDIEMPMEDGYSMITKVRRMAVADGGAVPAVALTAYARKDDERRALAAGFQRHMPKPVEPRELVAALAGLVGRPVDAASLKY